jgi:putative membrane protein
MIKRYSDHAANERTFLAWVRTGIAIIALGFVVEKFNLFVRTLAEANSTTGDGHLRAAQLSGSFSQDEGLVLILIGIVTIMISLVRVIRTGRLLNDSQIHDEGSVRSEIVLTVVVAQLPISPFPDSFRHVSFMTGRSEGDTIAGARYATVNLPA